MSKILLQVTTPQGVLFDEEVDRFTVPTERGPLEISPGYTTLVAACSPAGVMKIYQDGKPRFFAIFDGFLTVSPHGARILADDLEDGYTIDMARAIASRDRAQDRLEKKEDGTDLVRAKLSLWRALARIEAKQKSEGGR